MAGRRGKDTAVLSGIRRRYTALELQGELWYDLYGNYIPGLCAGLAIAMEDLGRSLDANRYPVLDRLTATGIRGLYHAAATEHGYVPQRSAFINHCDLCTDIRLFLIRKEDVSFNELKPAGHYADMYQS